jgi:hypothetical protein
VGGLVLGGWWWFGLVGGLGRWMDKSTHTSQPPGRSTNQSMNQLTSILPPPPPPPLSLPHLIVIISIPPTRTQAGTHAPVADDAVEGVAVGAKGHVSSRVHGPREAGQAVAEAHLLVLCCWLVVLLLLLCLWLLLRPTASAGSGECLVLCSCVCAPVG